MAAGNHHVADLFHDCSTVNTRPPFLMVLRTYYVRPSQLGVLFVITAYCIGPL